VQIRPGCFLDGNRKRRERHESSIILLQDRPSCDRNEGTTEWPSFDPLERGEDSDLCLSCARWKLHQDARRTGGMMLATYTKGILLMRPELHVTSRTDTACSVCGAEGKKFAVIFTGYDHS
jgi:hypothetical protein